MPREWHELTRITQGAPLLIERVRVVESDISIEGSFELPPLAQLPAEDQFFVMAFVRCHGSIKEMEHIFGISYPTVKNRLTAISARLDSAFDVPATPAQILDKLAAGEISVEEALRRLS